MCDLSLTLANIIPDCTSCLPPFTLNFLKHITTSLVPSIASIVKPFSLHQVSCTKLLLFPSRTAIKILLWLRPILVLSLHHLLPSVTLFTSPRLVLLNTRACYLLPDRLTLHQLLCSSFHYQRDKSSLYKMGSNYWNNGWYDASSPHDQASSPTGYSFDYYQSQPLVRYGSSGSNSQASTRGPESPTDSYYTLHGSPTMDDAVYQQSHSYQQHYASGQTRAGESSVPRGES
jgi:hypothetical protein